MAKHELKKIIGGSAFVFICRVSGAGLVLITQILLARWAGAEELGVYVTAFSWCVVLSILAGMGYPAAAFRVISQALAADRIDQVRGFIGRGRQIIFMSSLVIVAILAALILFTEIVAPERRDTFLIALCIIPMLALIHLQDGLTHAYSWFVIRFLPTPVLRPLLFLNLICYWWFSQGVITAEKIMLLQLVAMLVIGIGQYWLVRRKLVRVLGKVKPTYETRTWTRVSMPLLIVLLFTQFYAEMNVVIVGMQLPANEVAIFNTAFRVAVLIAFIINAVDGIVRPKAARFYVEGNTDALQKLVARSTQLMFWPALLVVILIAVLGKWILGLFGAEFVVGYNALLILAIAQLFLTIAGPVASLLSTTGFQDHCLYVFASALVATVVFNIALLPHLGIDGAAISVLLVTGFSTIWMHTLVVKHIGIEPSVLALRHAFK